MLIDGSCGLGEGALLALKGAPLGWGSDIGKMPLVVVNETRIKLDTLHSWFGPHPVRF